MAIIVPVRPPIAPTPAAASVSVLNGLVVSQRDWVWIAQALAYARGRGLTLVPAFDPLRAVAAGATATFNFRAYQRYPCIQRLWIVRAHRGSVTSGETVTVTLKAPSGGTAQTYAVSNTTPIGGPAMWLLEDGVTQTDGEVDLSIDIINGSGSTTVVVDEILSVELPRMLLAAGGSEGGTDANTDRGGEPIFRSTTGESVGGIVDALKKVENQPNRNLFSWSSPDASAITTNSTTDVDVFQPAGTTTGNPKVRIGVATKRGRTATVKTVQIRARLKASGAGVGGRVLFTSRLGATGTCTLTAGTTSFAWYTGTIDVDCENMSASDGRQSSASEELSVVFKNTGTPGTVSCSGIAVIDG